MKATEITIRHSEASDAGAIKAIYACPNAYAGTLQLPYPSSRMWEQRIAERPDNVYSYVALIGDEVVGNLGFTLLTRPRRRHAGGFGLAVKDDYQKRGVGKALLTTLLDLTDNWLNVKRVELTVFVDNEAAIALYKKFGFVVEGEARDYAFRDGEFVNVYYMARLIE